MILYSIYDNVGKTNVLTMLAKNFGTLKRDIIALLYNNPNFREFCADYSIVEIGNLSDDLVFTACTPVVVGEVNDIARALSSNVGGAHEGEQADED